MPKPPPLPASLTLITPTEGSAGDCIAEYEARITAFDKRSVYKLRHSHLSIESELRSRVILLTDVTEVRCRFFPTRVQRDRYETLLTLRGGGTLKICNQFFRGMADFEDRSTTYTQFIVALHRQLAESNPSCVY